ncbi:MAG: SUMF1/EgtB/PvdO family nonheme iron enzyme [Labilithrix sp.]|nr:SUMF1/EgtB/PvdO family nonheme iron enzyme [Labilithrix sp.]
MSTIGGRYALSEEIASGGMATVHLARQIGAGGFARIVAVKRLHERFARDPELVGMFLDEARLVARIRHPNVVQTVDVVAEDGELFLVMEYVHGESLLRVIQLSHRRDLGLPVGVTASIVAGALQGLHEAHEARSETGEPLGIVHRDVSPQNILVGVDGVARVLDFGVAKATQRIQSTLDGQLKGKLSYMAPEQVRNGRLDRRTDVYAASVVLWEALTGTKLFYGENEAAVLTHIMLEKVRPPSSLNGAVPPALDEVVMRGLAREASDRFASAQEMARAIERAIPLASHADVAATVTGACAESLSRRAALIAEIEARSSSSNLREAASSLRSLRQDAARSSSREAVARISARPPIQTVPPPGLVDVAVHANVASFPPPAGSGGPPRAPAPGIARGRVFATIAAAAVVLLLLLSAGGFLALRRRAHAGPAATSLAIGGGSAIVAAHDGGPVSAGVAATPIDPCPEGMALVAGGRFFMGSDDDLPAERPAHKVVLRAYCMDKREVSTDAYRACSDRGDCKRAAVTNRWSGITPKDSKIYDPLCNAADSARGSHPVNCVDWHMADRFCKAEGKRLPTEAEWEFAARGSDGRKYPWGDAAPTPKHLNACGVECLAWGKKQGASLEALFSESDPFPTTAPVGSFPAGASPWGIEDIVGNVWEWVGDWYDAYGASDQEDPRGPATGATRAMRGGAWNGAHADWVRPTFRFHDAPDTRSHGVGFRCAKSP